MDTGITHKGLAEPDDLARTDLAAPHVADQDTWDAAVLMAAQTWLLPLLDGREAAERVFNRPALRLPDVSLAGEPGGE